MKVQKEGVKDVEKSLPKLRKNSQNPSFKEEERQVVEAPKEEIKEGSMKEFFANPTFVRNMLILVFDWTFIIFSQYLLSFLVKYLPGDKYLNLLLISFADLSPSILSGLIMTFLSRRTAMIVLPAIMVLLCPIYYLTRHVLLFGMICIFII
jgi:Na+/melibiose symporter-like transporter